MKINRMTDYALRITRTVSESPVDLITSEEIAEKENLTSGIVLKIMRILSQAGIVLSHRGRGKVAGGFTLKKPLNQITLLTIIELMEGRIEFNPINENDKKCCKSEDEPCALHKELNTLTEMMREELSRYTLEDILIHDDCHGLSEISF